jgi:UTP--glucose-1-phosphate uridylyltransferase
LIDVVFGSGVVLRGQVVVFASDGEKLTIPSGCLLENCIVQGALEIVSRS